MADELENDEDCEMDFRRLKQSHLKAGYVDGLLEGEESSIQQGFNEGFAKCVKITSEVSKLLGSMSAVLSYLDLKHSKKNQDYSKVIKEISKLKDEVKTLEQKALIECEKSFADQDQESKTVKGNDKDCADDDATRLPKNKETGCKSVTCCKNDSETHNIAGNTNICSGDNGSCKNNKKTLAEAEGQSPEVTTNNNSSFYSEMGRIQKHFRNLVKIELNVVLH